MSQGGSPRTLGHVDRQAPDRLVAFPREDHAGGGTRTPKGAMPTGS
jgi:hypothetical protein